MKAFRKNITERPRSRTGLCSAWLVAGLLFAQQAGAWPDLRIVKSGPAQAAPGDVITYTLTYSNVGGLKSTSVMMKDFLPTNTTALTNTLNGGTLSGSTISWSLGILNVNAKGSRSFQVRINTNTPSGSFVTNRSQIFGSEAEETGKTNDNYSKVITSIIGVNRAPVAQPDAYTVAEDGTLTITSPGVLGNDSDPDGNTMTAILVSGPAYGTLTLNPNGGFTYTPSPNYNGPDTFTYKANDGTTNSGVVTVTLNVTAVNDAPVAQPDAYTVAEDGVLTVAGPGVLVNDSDVDGDALTAAFVTGPAHGTLTLNPNGGFIYTPNLNYFGPDAFTYRANDGTTNSSIATVTLTVTAVNDAPVAQPDSYTVAEDGTLTIAGPGVLSNDSDADGDTLTAILVNGPTHGTLILNPNGSFSYIPNPNYNGPDSFTYRANDGTTNSAIVTVMLNVTAANDAPMAQPDSYTLAEDGTLTIAGPGVLGNDSDPDGDPLTAILVNGPSHGTLTLNPDGSFSYTPNPNYNGPDSFTYRANDGTTNSGIVTVTLNVTAVNDAPVAQPDSYTVAEDGVLTIAGSGVLGNDSDVDGDPLTAIMVNGPTHGTLTLNPDGSFSYTPNQNYNGPDSFTYRANDGTTNSGVVTATFNVTPVNDAPLAQGDQYSTPRNLPLNILSPGVLANDSDSDGDPLTAILVNGPTHGSMTLSSNGGFIYIPNTNYTGPDAFTYRANDGTTNSGLATVTLNVTPVNDAPVAQPDSYTVAEDGPLTISAPGVLGNDSDPNGDVLTAILVNGPTHGTLTLNPDGSFSYAPNPNYNGPDSFAYRANDGTTNSGVVTVTLNVTAVNDAPVAQPDAYTLAEDGTLTIAGPGVLGNDSDPDGDALSAILVNGPTHGTLTLNPDGSFSYTPNQNYNGPDSFTYRANDGTTNSGIVTVTLNVTAVNDTPVAQDDSYTTTENVPLIVSAPGVLNNDSDVDGNTLSAIVVMLPTHGQLALSTNGGFSYIPTTNFTGTDLFTYLANDGVTNSSIATVTITVTQTNSPPDTNNWTGSQFTAYEDTTLNVGAPGVLAGMVDADGDVLMVIPVSDTSHGTLTLHTNGSFSYLANTNYFGPDSFQFRVSDGQSSSAVLTATINVLPVNDPPAFVKGGNVRIQPNSGAQTVVGWATQISPGPTNEAGQTVTFEVTSSNPALFAVAPVISANGTLTYTPATNVNGTATISVIARDNGGTANGGVNASMPQTFTIVINAPPTVQIVSPANGAFYFSPASFTVLADATDPDGSITKVAFYAGTNLIATVTNAPHFTLLTNLPNGTYSFTAVATDDFGATNSSSPVTVSVIDFPLLTLLSSVYYNPQTDFFEQRVRVTNPTSSRLDAVRVLIHNLTNIPPITVVNASGQTNGVPYVQTFTAVPPDSSVDMVIEFASPLRLRPNPVLVAQLVQPLGPPVPVTGLILPINRSLMLSNQTFLVEFATQANRYYVVQYSDDAVIWKNSQPAIPGNGTWVQWIDFGLPKTDRHPREVPSRFYRTIQLP